MATVEQTRVKQRRFRAEPEVVVKRRFRRLRWAILLFLVLLGAVIGLAPTIIANTSLAGPLLETVLEVDGSVRVGSVSLGWFSSVVLGQVEIRDPQGEVVIEIETFASEKSLVAMLLDLADLGKLYVVRPKAHVVAHQTDSNLEQVFASLASKPHASRVTAQLELTEGTLDIHDLVADRRFLIENVAVNYHSSGATNEPVLTASGDLTSGRQAASFKIDMAVGGPSDDPLANGSIDCQVSGLPLELFEPLVRRRLTEARLSGLVTSRLNGAWGDRAQRGEASLRGETLITRFDFAAESLGADHVHLDRIQIPCHIVQDEDWVRFEQFALNCELGEIELTGTAKLADFSAPDKLAAFTHTSCELKGHVDLSKVAQMLSETLSLRAGTEITSGELSFSAATRPQGDTVEWSGRLATSSLVANVNGRQVTWNNPLSVEFVARETNEGIVIDRGHCASNFLQIDAEGSPDDWSASAEFDLARLMTELRKFSDLGRTQLAGNGQAQLVWKRVRADQFDARAEFQARDFKCVIGELRPWVEENLVVTLEAAGMMSGHRVTRLASSQMTIEAGSERLEARVRRAVADPATAEWPLEFTWTGQLQHWATRLETCLNISGWDLAGTGTMQAELIASRERIDIERAYADFTQFQVHGHGYTISEPAVEVNAEGRYAFATRRLDLTRGELFAGTSVAVVDRAVVEPGSAGAMVNAAVEYSAELAQVSRWRHDPRTPLEWQLAGKLTGKAQLRNEPEAASAQLNADVENFEVIDHTQPNAPRGGVTVWQEPQIKLAGLVRYRRPQDEWQIEKVELACAALHSTINGSLAARGNVDLKGTVEYDWQELTPLVHPYLGPNIDVVGRQTREVAVHGRLTGDIASVESWREVIADASVGWTGMNIHGLAVGQGEIVAQLSGGQVHTRPMDVEISEGRLTITPLVRLDARPIDVLIGRGPLLTDVHLTPEMCAQGLKFIAPVLANSTRADGRFSVTLEGGRLPLSDPAGGDIGGRIAMRGQARPGPVAQEFLKLLGELSSILQRGKFTGITDQNGALVSIDESNVEFRMVNRRVYHRGLRFKIGNTPITTSGWVGLDESLGVLAEVPIQAKLFGVDLSLGALEGQVLQIPIGGNLDNPKLDPRALQQLTTQMIGNTAKGVFIDGVGKQLEKLFPK